MRRQCIVGKLIMRVRDQSAAECESKHRRGSCELTLHFGFDELNKGLTPCENPSIHDIGTAETLGIVFEVDTLILLEEGGLSEEESVRVEKRKENVRDDILDTFLLESEGVATDDRRVDQEESKSVGTISVDDQVWIRVVLERFRHLLSVGSENVTTDDEVLPGSSVEKVGRENEESVEPSSSLIHSFRDEVGRERFLELLLVLEGVVDLSVGHTGSRSLSAFELVQSTRKDYSPSRLEPTIEYFLDTLEVTFTLLARDSDVIDLVSVKIGDTLDAREFLELFDRRDADNLFPSERLVSVSIKGKYRSEGIPLDSLH